MRHSEEQMARLSKEAFKAQHEIDTGDRSKWS
jgi:hypothetical protein